jgi:mono/diheme cytochrome c family protein
MPRPLARPLGLPLTALAAALGLAACDDTLFNSAGEAVSGEGIEAVYEVVDANCVACHGETAPSAGLDLRAEVFCDNVLDGRLVVPNDAAGSVLYQRVSDAGSPMPPTGLMPDENITIIGDWIDAGAPCDSTGGGDGTDGTDGTGGTDGEQLFLSGCAGCHGADGDSGYAPNLSAEVPGEDLADLVEVISEGKDTMPPVYTDLAQAEAVAQYLLDTFGG